MASLPATVARPAYDPRSISIGTVHLGIGAFHRAHQALFTDGLLSRDPRWGICGVSLQTTTAREQLAPQDGLYTIALKSAAGVERRVVGALREVLFAGEQKDAVIARIAAPGTKIITLMVTEKGYCHDPATVAAAYKYSGGESKHRKVMRVDFAVDPAAPNSVRPIPADELRR